MIVIFDIDDVLRDLSKRTEQYARLFFRGDMKKYTDYSKKEVEMFDFLRLNPDLFALLFEHPYPNYDLLDFIDSLSEVSDLYALSMNSNVIAKMYTKDFLLSESKIPQQNIIFVNKSSDKVKWVKKNISDLKDVYFVDDRLDTILQFEKSGIKCFWFTEYKTKESIDKWIKHNKSPKNMGGNDELIEWLKNNY